jgi:lysophospholipase L1-like esterase
VNNILREAFARLKQEGVSDLYLLSHAVINLALDGTVDGVHPNDLGMLDYARAYEQMLRIVLQEPIGEIATTQPVVQRRDRRIYEWEQRHQHILKKVQSGNFRNVILGNSIIHFWADMPGGPLTTGEVSWKKYIEPHQVANLGYGWDRIENVLWRVYHEELTGYTPDGILLMIGTNNFSENTDEEILIGLDFLLGAIRARQPDAVINIAGILPRRGEEERVKSINEGIEQLTYNLKGVKFVDFGHLFLNEQGKLNESLFADGLHPNAKGYELLGSQISQIF